MPSPSISIQFTNSLLDLRLYKNVARNMMQLRIDEEWQKIPASMKRELGYDENGRTPVMLYEMLDNMPGDGDDVAVSPLLRVDTGWEDDPQKIMEIYGDTPIDIIDEAHVFLTDQNVELNFYPDLLHLKAAVLIRDWNSLDQKKQKLIWDLQEQADRLLLGRNYNLKKRDKIPELFLYVWYEKSVPQNQVPNIPGANSPSTGGSVLEFDPIGDGHVASTTKPVARTSVSSGINRMMAGVRVLWGQPAAVSAPVRTQMILKPVFAK